MANENETVMAVCAEWRDCIESADPSVWNDARIAGLVKTTKAQQLAYLDRVEAAWKREREKIAAETRQRSAADSGCPNVLKNTDVIIAQSAPVGNAAARDEVVLHLSKEEYKGMQEALSEHDRLCEMLSESRKSVGNAAAMREALVAIRKALLLDSGMGPHTAFHAEVDRLTADALAAPARNCDRFADEIDAQIAFLNEVWLISVDRDTMLEQDQYENWTDEMRTRYGRWLIARAAERKGDGNEQK